MILLQSWLKDRKALMLSEVINSDNYQYSSAIFVGYLVTMASETMFAENVP